jgi:hypothetical protein
MTRSTADLPGMTNSSSALSPTWQCVMVCWGDKYSVELINHLMAQIEHHAQTPPRFVLICDQPKPGLRPGAMMRNFPDFFLTPIFKKSGCQAKLAMFEKGVLPEDLPAIYIDLDTIVLGDISKGLKLMDTRQTVAMLPSAIIPFGPIGRTLWKWTDKKNYARGNSSMVLFHPAECHYVAETFRNLFAQHPEFGFRPMVADERFISWVAQPHMKKLPKTLIVKFPGEFMFPWRWWLYVKAWLPWVRSRRAQLTAITLNGLLIKPEMLLQLTEGEVVVDNKSRQLVWSPATMGDYYHRIREYYKFI